MAKGIDVSHWQGTIDWSKVKADGINFAILKAGGSDDGFYTDSTFEANYAGAKAVGMEVGAYYIVGPEFTNTAAGEADALRFLEILKGKQFEYPVALDLELTRPTDKVGATNASIAFCETMEKAGYYVVIYASDISGFKYRLEADRLTSFDKWVARYGSKPLYVTSYGIWQQSSTGSVSGIRGNVDMNEAYKMYSSIIRREGLNGFSKHSKPSKPTVAKKSVDELAKEVIRGDWGNGEARKNAITKAGYDYAAVQKRVDELMSGTKTTSTVKSIDDLAREVIRGDWGNGRDRKDRLTKAGYDYIAVQKRVDEIL